MTEAPGKIVVTGGGGRIGSAIAAAARRLGLRVLRCDLRPGPDVERADVGDLGRLVSLFEGADCIIHSAGLHAPHVGVFSDADFRHVNIEGTANVLRAARRAAVGSVVFTSTTALLGGGAPPGAPARWIDDSTAPDPRSIYHETKIAAEALVRSECGGRLSASILRLGRCFDEPPAVMAIHRLSRGIDARDAAIAHLRAARFVSHDPAPLIASYSTPFRPADCTALGGEADRLVRERCPALARQFDALGWALPTHIDRIYDSHMARKTWHWRPQFGPLSVLADRSHPALPLSQPSGAMNGQRS